MSKVKYTIGDNMKKHQKKLGISQDILSKKANLAFNTVAKIEPRAPNLTIETVEKIAGALGISLDDLIK